MFLLSNLLYFTTLHPLKSMVCKLTVFLSNPKAVHVYVIGRHPTGTRALYARER